MRCLFFALLLLFVFIPAGGMANKSYSISGLIDAAIDMAPETVFVSSNADLRIVLADNNKRYVIHDSFDLHGKTVSVGTNSVLVFDGGRISNGTLQMNGSAIESVNQCFSSLILKGYDDLIYAKWYGKDLNKLLSSTCNSVIVLEPTTYYVTEDVLIGANTFIRGNNSTIISTANIYLGWRCRIENVSIKNNTANKACLVINSKKIGESISLCDRLADDIQVVAGIEINHCSLYGKVLKSEKDDTQSNCVRIEAEGGYYGWDYSIVNCFMNGGSAAIEFFNSGAIEEKWMTNFFISRNISTNNGCFIKFESDSKAKKNAFSGINIEGNGVQWNYCTNYFIQLESVSCVTMTNNNFWDHGWEGAIRMSTYGCTNIEISDYMAISDVAGDFVTMYDIKGNNPKRISQKPSNYHLNATGSGDYLYSFPTPLHKDTVGSYYTLSDIYKLSDGSYFMSDIQTRALLRGAPFLSSIGKYPRFMLSKVSVGNTVYVDVSPFTTYAGSNIMEKTTNHWFILRLCFVSNQGFEDIPIDFNKFVSLNGTFSAPKATYAMPGVVYYDTDDGKLVYIDDKNNVMGLKGTPINYNMEGPLNGRPNLSLNDKGSTYFCTDKNITITWNGEEWMEYDGEQAGIRRYGPYSLRPFPRNIGFSYFNTDTHRSMTWDGNNWYYSDGVKATY